MTSILERYDQETIIKVLEQYEEGLKMKLEEKTFKPRVYIKNLTDDEIENITSTYRNIKGNRADKIKQTIEKTGYSFYIVSRVTKQ